MRVRITTVYRDWINGLRDHVARAHIQVRVDRLVHGNPGSHRALREGVSELKIDKSFVMEMTVNDQDAVIVRALVELALAFNGGGHDRR